MSRIAVVADAHIGGPGGAGAELFGQLRALPDAGCTDLLLLGDLFHVWVGSPKYESQDIRDFIELANQLRVAGIRVHYVEGNRDFFLDDSAYRQAFDRFALELTFDTTSGQRVLAVHGDRINTADKRHIFWSRFSKSAPVRVMMRGLPYRLARWLVDSAEREIAKTNQKYRLEIPEDALRQFGEKRIAEGIDLVVMGHFHEPATIQVAGGEVRLIDAWFHSRKVEWLA